MEDVNRGWTVILQGFFFLWVFLVCCFAMTNMDIWWHLRTGQLIWEQGTVPQLDWFTYTNADRPWIDLHWGFQLLVAGLYAAGGVSLLILVKAAAATATVACGWAAVGRELPTWCKAGLWLLPVIVISGRAYVRPEMLSLLFLAIWFLILERMERHPRWVWGLPLLQIVWINCHALFVLGLVVAGAFAVDWIVRLCAQGRWGLAELPQTPSRRALIIAGLLVVAAAFVNPYLHEGAFFPWELYKKFSVDQEFYSARIGEFQQPLAFVKNFGLTNVYLQAEVALWLATAASFFTLAVFARWSPMRMLLFAAFSHLAWEASRNSSLFAVVAGLILCANIRDAIVQWRSRSSARGVNSPQHRLPTQVAVAGVWCLLLGIATGLWGEWSGEGKFLSFGVPEEYYMDEAAQFVGQEGFPKTAFVGHMGHASMFSYRNGPGKKVFMDGRLEVCSRETFERYFEVRRKMATGDPSWQEIVRGPDGRLPVILLDSRSNDSRAAIMALGRMRDSWRLVFADGSGAVFIDVATANRLGLREADPKPLMFPPGI